MALRKRFGPQSNERGYVNWPHDNLVEGIRLEQFESDLRQGDGNELQMKFCAVHSSAALAVNSFAIFKERTQAPNLELLGHCGPATVRFEKRLEIFPQRWPANVDVWLDFGARVVAIESKLSEYFNPKVAEFARAYETLKPPWSEQCWWNAREEATGKLRYLDTAQLVKHYFGLRRLRETDRTGPANVTLLYLFWEPTNWRDIAPCVQHREELKALADGLSQAAIPLEWMTYSHLWDQWSNNATLRDHALRLKQRYEVAI